jgi:hypothetical protein
MNHPDSVDHCTNCGTALPSAGAAIEPKVNAAAEPSVNQPAIRIESHLVKAIISAVCCCLPLGIAAVVFAAQVGPNLKSKNYEAASEAGKKANLWGNLAIGVGVVMQILWIVFYQLIFEVLLGHING